MFNRISGLIIDLIFVSLIPGFVLSGIFSIFEWKLLFDRILLNGVAFWITVGISLFCYKLIMRLNSKIS